MNRINLLAIIASAGLVSTSIAQEPAVLPRLPNHGAQPAAKPAAKPAANAPLYDEKADAKQQIAAALKSAKKENRRVLIQWGFNTCHWCQLMHKTFTTDRAIMKELQYEYDLVHIDAGANGKNMDLAASYGADLKTHGFPYLTVLDADGKPLANQETSSLEIKDEKGESVLGSGSGHDPAKLLKFMKANEAKPLIADSVLADARTQAKASGKKVFVHFGAPWCPWCHVLENWLAQPEVAALMSKDFLDTKIDQDRMTGGKDLLASFKPKGDGIPWFAIIDPDSGKVLANSDGEKGNIGYPSEPHEIAHFVTVLQATKKNLSDSDIAALKTSLEAGRKH